MLLLEILKSKKKKEKEKKKKEKKTWERKNIIKKENHFEQQWLRYVYMYTNDTELKFEFVKLNL